MHSFAFTTFLLTLKPAVRNHTFNETYDKLIVTCSVCDPVPVIFNFPPGVAVSLSLVFELRDMVCLDASSGTDDLSASVGPSPSEICRVWERGNVEAETVLRFGSHYSYNNPLAVNKKKITKYEHLSLLYLGSCALSLLNWSAVMQVHCGSLDRLGEVGVDSGFFLTFVLCLFDVSNFKEYDDDDFRDNFTVGVYDGRMHISLFLLNCT